MQRFSFWRRDRQQQPTQPGAKRRDGGSATIPIRDAERRRLSRLLTRRTNIEYDIANAETAYMPQNRWTERVEQLNDAIGQAEEDLGQLRAERGTTPEVNFPATPIEIDVQSTEPAEIALRVGSATFVFREEVDWAERGHQLALPKLTQASGDASVLVPTTVEKAAKELLTSHLTNSLSIIANEALRHTLDDGPLPELTLSDLVRPCDECGGWLDPLGRCPACAELNWQRQEITAASARLVDERNDVMADLERARERLPVLRRQLQDAEHDIEELRAKGVEPDGA
ncbi:MAG: hypothetical protein WBW04_07360 [Nitrolancea sp.]